MTQQAGTHHRAGMRRRRLIGFAGIWVLLLSAPAWAAPPSPQRPARSDPAPQAGGPQVGERQAMTLLQAAVRAGQKLTYSGTQYAAFWRAGRGESSVAEVHHDPVGGAQIFRSAAAGQSTAAGEPAASAIATTAVLDARQVAVLAERYTLRVAAPGLCLGRTAWVVEARAASDRVAGRFWIDRSTALVLRREVYDAQGGRLLSSAFTDLAVSEAPAGPVELPPAGRVELAPAGPVELAPTGPVELAPTGRDAVPDVLASRPIPAAGLPAELPGGYALFDSMLMFPRPGEQVRHLAYSDGLSTVSLFVQDGQLGSAGVPGFDPDTVGARPVWVSHSWLERVVWSGGGKVFTLVSDAAPASIRAVVGALPRDPAPETGLLARLGRGVARLVGMLNPFN